MSTLLTTDAARSLLVRGCVQADGKGYTDIASLAGIDGLKKLDLRSNKLRTLTPAVAGSPSVAVVNAAGNELESVGEGTPGCCPSLRSLDLSENPLTTLAGVEVFDSLNVLIAARCPKLQLSCAPVAALPLLHTLVLRDVPVASSAQLAPLMRMRTLRKLVLGGCGLTELPWGNRAHHLSLLTELKLNGNAIASLNRFLSGCKELKTLDLGNNKLAEDCLEIVATLPHLTHLTLKGNPLEQQTSDEAYRSTVLAACRGKVKYLDNSFATDDVASKKAEKRAFGEGIREGKRKKLAIEADAEEAAAAAAARAPVSNAVRANVVLLDVAPRGRVASKEEILKEYEAEEESLFELKGLKNFSSSGERESGLARSKTNADAVWTASDVLQPTKQTKADDALAFLLGR